MNFMLYKCSLKSYFFDPLIYLCGVLTVVFSSLRFFYGAKFFAQGLGSTDLSLFFETIPVIGVITIPLLVFRIRRFIKDDSLAISPLKKYISLSLSVLTAFALPLVLTFLVPIFVGQFGDVDLGQIFSSYLGILFFALCAIFISILIFSFEKFSGAVSIFVCVIILEIINYVHLVPYYFNGGRFLVKLFQVVSFSNHYESFARGIIDLRVLVYYCAVMLFLLFCCIYVEFKRTGQKIQLTNGCYYLFSIIFLVITFNNVYFKLDLSSGSQYSVSDFSKELLNKIDQPLRITYYKTPQLTDFYPQSKSVLDYLETFCEENSNILLNVENADPLKLSTLGIYAQQVRNNNESKTEIINLYSAILLQYKDREEIIQFSINTQSLEYDLSKSVQKLLFNSSIRLFLISGNDLDFSQKNSYAPIWFEQRGFDVHIVSNWEMISTLNNLTSRDCIVVTGSKNFTSEQSLAIMQAINHGVHAFICTTPYSASIDEDFSVVRNEDDTLIPLLNKEGFAFDSSLIHDISCYPMELADARGAGQTFIRNYPLWINILPQKKSPNGLYVFWSSPIDCYKNVKPIAFTTEYSWTVREDKNSSIPFITNPFTIAMSAGEKDYDRLGPFSIAASIEKQKFVTVVADQYFLNNLVPNQYVNLDFTCSQIYRLFGQEDFAYLMEKNIPNKSLYKITNEKEFEELRQITIFVCSILCPIFIIALYFTYKIIKRKKLLKKDNL